MYSSLQSGTALMRAPLRIWGKEWHSIIRGGRRKNGIERVEFCYGWKREREYRWSSYSISIITIKVRARVSDTSN